MKQRVIIVCSLVLALAALAVFGTELAFAQTAAATGTKLNLQSGPRVDENGNIVKGQLILTATLTTADGKPVSDQSIRFFEQVTFMGGPREALLGTATTDSTGVAAIQYQPAQKGTDQIVARFASSGDYQAAEAHLSLDVNEVVAPFTTQPVPFAAVGTGLSVAFALLVVGACAVLLGVFLRTVIGIRAAARPAASRVAAEVPSSGLAESRR